MKKLLTALLLTFVLAFTYSCSDSAGDPADGGGGTKPPIIVDPEVPEVPEPDPDDEVIETGKEWKNIKFLDNVSVPNPDGITIVDKFIVSTAPGTETVTQTEAIVDTYTYDQFKTYITTLKASKLYTDKTHSNILYVLTEESLLPTTLEDTKSTYFVFDNDTHYAIVTYYGNSYVDATRSTTRPNLSVKLTRKDPFSKIGGKLKVMKDVLWTDLKFEEGAELPEPVGTVALVIYDNATDKQEMSIDIKEMTSGQYTSYLNDIRGASNLTTHKAIPSSAKDGISTSIGDGTLKSATWVSTDKLNRYISVAYIGANFPTYDGNNFKITINSKDPFAKGSGEKVIGLSMTDAIAKLPVLTVFPEPAFITGNGEVVAFNDTNYGKEIRFEIEDNNSNYTAFRNYLGVIKWFQFKSGLIAEEFKDKTHSKVPAMILGIAFGIAIPEEYDNTNTRTGAWAFVEDNGEYTSFIWHSKSSPNNPNKNGKATFIIERMTFDPMWFLP